VCFSLSRNDNLLPLIL